MKRERERGGMYEERKLVDLGFHVNHRWIATINYKNNIVA